MTLAAVDRSTYIGSSDAAMAADLSPWGSPLTVWNRLTGLVPHVDRPTLRMYLGERMEPILLDLFEARTGRRPERLLRLSDPPILSAEHPFIGAHPDFDHLEVKTSSSDREWGEDGSTATVESMVVPLHYFLQVQHQMYVMGWDTIDVAVLIRHDEFRTYSVPADAVVIERLVAAEAELWDFAQRGEPPPKGDRDSRRAYLRARFPYEHEPPRPPTPEEEALVASWRIAKSLETEAKRQIDEFAFEIESAIGDAAGLTGLVSWRRQSRRTIDADALRAELHEIGRDDILERVTRETTFRVLRSTSRDADAVLRQRVEQIASTIAGDELA